MERGSWFGVVGVLGGALLIGSTATENWLDATRVLDAGVSYGLLLVLAASVVLAAVRRRLGGVASPRASPPGRSTCLR